MPPEPEAAKQAMRESFTRAYCSLIGCVMPVVIGVITVKSPAFVSDVERVSVPVVPGVAAAFKVNERISTFPATPVPSAMSNVKVPVPVLATFTCGETDTPLAVQFWNDMALVGQVAVISDDPSVSPELRISRKTFTVTFPLTAKPYLLMSV